MILEGQGSPETPAGDAPPASPSPEAAPAPSGDPAPESELAPGEQAPAAAAPAYQVNPVFKVRNTEKKFDDWMIPNIKDADTEKKVRELYEKAHGLEFVKTDRERLQADVQSFREREQKEYMPVIETARRIVHFRDQGNFPAMFQQLGLQPQQVFQWAYNYSQLSPQERAAHEQAGTTAMQAYEASNQASTVQQQAYQQAVDFREREYDMMVRYNPQVSQAQAEFDNQHGQGAFFDQVKRTGIYHWTVNKQDIPVEQAVNEVLKLIGRAQPAQPQVSPGLNQQAAGFQPQQSVAPPQAPTPKPVIPNIQGTGTSPAKRVYTSMEDIKKRKRELEAEEMNG
jgi:hypothetical protein